MNDETDLHGEEMAEAEIIRESLSCPSGDRPREPESPASAFAVAGGWPAEVAYPSAEVYFIDRDLFVEYVRSVLNPAREKEELSTCTPAVAAHLFDVMTTRRYRQPVGKQANNPA